MSHTAFKLLFDNYYSPVSKLVEWQNINTTNKYIIVDIKSSAIHLNIDGLTCRNTDLLKLYKIQLAVYGYIMEENYNMTDVLTYILPHTAKLESSSKYNGFSVSYNNMTTIIPYESRKLLVCAVDMAKRDILHKNDLRRIYDEYLQCTKLYNDNVPITFIYNEQVKELQQVLHHHPEQLADIIKCNKLLNINEDMVSNNTTLYNSHVRGSGKMADHLSLKVWIAKQTRSLSLLRGFNDETIRTLKQEGICSYIKTDGLVEYVEKNNIRNKLLIQTIIKANDIRTSSAIYCNNITNKKKEFDDTIMQNKLLFCLDFETIPNKLITNMLNDNYDFTPDQEYDSFTGNQTIFMIGCNTFKNVNGAYILTTNAQFMLPNISSSDDINAQIKELFVELHKHIVETLQTHKVKKTNAAFVIWSPFEISVMKHISSLDYELIYEEEAPSLYGIKIIDLMQMFSAGTDPIGVRGAFDCSIKSIATGLQISGALLNVGEFWNSEIINGMDAMYYALFYYCNMKCGTVDENINKKFLEICYYNDVDCSIMCNIINSVYKLLN